MLRIEIGPQKDLIALMDRECYVFSAVIRESWWKTIYLANTDTFSEVEDLQVYFRENRKKKVLEIPSETKYGMIEFLNHYHARPGHNLDCYAFANIIHGVPDYPSSLLLKFWDIEPLTTPIIGSTIFLLDIENCDFFHAAIYLGFGVYVSVYGQGGVLLEFSTLEDMRMCFGGDPYSARPIKKAAP